MANNINAFFETLLAAEEEYNRAPVGRLGLLDRVYRDISTESGRVGKTVQVYFPDLGPMTAINNGQLTATPVNPNYMSLVFQNRVGAGLLFEDFEQFQTATSLAQKFFDPLHKRAMEFLNGQIGSMFTTTNFNSNAPIYGAKQGEIQVTDLLGAWSNLADMKAPLEQVEKLSVFHHNYVSSKMLGDSQWTQENIASAVIALKARQEAELAGAYSFRPIWDQQMPTSSGSIIYGQVQPTNGSTTVTGINTQFTALTAGSSYLTFGCDPNKVQYKVSAIASDSSLTLSASYTGPTPTLNGVNNYTSARLITVLVGTVTVTSGSATVAGSGTAFTTALTVGQWLVFSADATATAYQILAIASNTSLTLATVAAAAAAGAAQTATVQSYTCCAMHEYAVGLALRPIATPPEASNVVDVTYLDLKGIPVRIIVSYQHIYQGLFVTADYGYALGVLRPQWGQLIYV